MFGRLTQEEIESLKALWHLKPWRKPIHVYKNHLKAIRGAYDRNPAAAMEVIRKAVEAEASNIINPRVTDTEFLMLQFLGDEKDR